MERDVLQRLLDQAFLYDDPHAYQAGVRAAWSVLERTRVDAPQGETQTPLLRGAAHASAAG